MTGTVITMTMVPDTAPAVAAVLLAPTMKEW